MQHDKPNAITLVMGGVRSGKSSFAQRIAEQQSDVTFVATATLANDEEMRRKIERHRAERPVHWITIEEPLDLPGVIERSSGTILIDCLTLYAANLLEAHRDDLAAQAQRVEGLCASLKATDSRVILVSNEVGSGVVPAYLSGRQFRDLVGDINQRVAAIAACVVLMVAGLPLLLKGELPTPSSANAAKHKRSPAPSDLRERVTL